MTELEWVGKVLEASVARKGEVPLTNAHLLNIIKMALRSKDAREQALEAYLNEIRAEDLRWGSD